MSPLLLALIAAGGGTVDPPPPTGWSLGEPGDPVWVPAGAFDTWRAARDNAENELVEVLYFGDSTGYGQQPAGLTPAPPPYMLRALSIADGHPDGGVGLYGDRNDHVAPAGVDHPGLTAPVAGRTVGDSWDMLLLNTWQSNVAAASVTFQGKGTRARIWATHVGSASGTFTYSLDGAAAVTVTPPADTTLKLAPTLLTMAEGTHTLTVTVVSGDVRVIVDWFRPVGIVWHRHSVPGQSSNYVVRGSNGSLLHAALGLNPAGSAPATKPTHRRVRLAIFGLGINDQQQSVATSTLKANATTFVTKARTAGADPLILVPHLEAANNNGNAPAYRQALYEVADEQDAALCDIGSGGALGPSAGWTGAGYVSSMTDPHLYALGYQTQMAYLWDNLLKL